MRNLVITIALCAGLGACGTGGDNRGTAASGRDGVVAGWTKAGLTVSAMTPDKSGAIGPDCTTGTVSGVDVALCVFAKPEDAKAAEAKGLTWVGPTTGVSLAHANLVLAVADRRAADPSGRTINTIAKTFRGR
jgi:hypothetical protein